MIDIFSYTDYRKYLSDVCAHHARATPHLSQRAVALKCRMDPGNFQRILAGTRNLTITAVDKVAPFLELDRFQREYLRSMVLFCNAGSYDDRKKFFEKMLSCSKSRVRVIDAENYEFYRKWYYSVVRESLSFFPCTDTTAATLAKMIVPPVTGQQVQKALALLVKLGLAQKDEDGVYRQTDKILSTGNDSRGITLSNFVFDTMNLAKESLARLPGEANLSAVSLAVSSEDFARIEEEVRGFRRRVLEIAATSHNPDQVFQCNVQLFPLSIKYRQKESG
jgi:uncharacterized protein (TIGR02147 family)